MDGSVTEITYRKLLELIEARHLAPGEVIEERVLALRLKVLRTPLQAGISRSMLGEGRPEQLSNGSVIVRNIGIAELLELIHLRLVLESEVAALAATRIGIDVLQPIKANLKRSWPRPKSPKPGIWPWTTRSTTRSPVIAQPVAGAPDRRDLVARSGCAMRSGGRSGCLPACREHLAIVDAIIKRDAAVARHAIIQHLTNVRQGMLETYRKFFCLKATASFIHRSTQSNT